MRKAMIERMVYDAMHEDLSLPRTDVVHDPTIKYLPKGEKPLSKKEDEYFLHRLMEENDKLTEWPYVYGP